MLSLIRAAAQQRTGSRKIRRAKSDRAYHASMSSASTYPAWCDGHLDLAYLAVNGRDVREPDVDPAIGCVTLPSLRKGGVQWMFATIFTELGIDGADRAHRYVDHADREGAHRAGMRQIECYQQLHRESAISIVRSAADLDHGATPRALILMEGADPIRSPDEVVLWHAMGLRMVGMAWAAGSRYAGGNGPPPPTPVPAHHRTGPLSNEGRDLVRALDEFGIIHDASHLSDAAFDDLMQLARGPIVATHSNCRALMNDWQRHLRDDQIIAIAQRGGIIGLNLFGKFLATGRRATIDDCIAHIEHIAEVTGRRDVVALGSDMDGGFGPGDLPVGLDHPTKLHALADALRARSWSDSEIAGFTHGNWLRVMRTALP